MDNKKAFLVAIKDQKDTQLKEQIYKNTIKLLITAVTFGLMKDARDGYQIVDAVNTWQELGEAKDALTKGEKDPQTGLRVVPPAKQTNGAFLLSITGGAAVFIGSAIHCKFALRRCYHLHARAAPTPAYPPACRLGSAQRSDQPSFR